MASEGWLVYSCQSNQSQQWLAMKRWTASSWRLGHLWMAVTERLWTWLQRSLTIRIRLNFVFQLTQSNILALILLPLCLHCIYRLPYVGLNSDWWQLVKEEDTKVPLAASGPRLMRSMRWKMTDRLLDLYYLAMSSNNGLKSCKKKYIPTLRQSRQHLKVTSLSF